MSALVLDASVALAYLLPGEEDHQRARAIIADGDASGGMVPSLWLTEIANALLVAERRKRMNRLEADRLLRAAAELTARSLTIEAAHASLLGKVHALARAHGLTAYDAAYLEVAMRARLPLATFDTALRGAAQADGVDLLPRVL